MRYLMVCISFAALLLAGCGGSDSNSNNGANGPDFLVTILNNSTAMGDTGVFNTPDGAASPAPALPGESYSFSFSAVPGDNLFFATMYVQSNDLFFAPDGTGIPLFMGSTPLTGDLTSQIMLWDAGTEVNQEPGVGGDQAPRQAAANTGTAEAVAVQLVADRMDGFTYPAVSSVLTATLSHDAATDMFTMTLAVNGASSTPIAPGAFIVNRGADAIFAAGSLDRGLGLEALAEDGDPSMLLPSLEGRSIAWSAPLTPGVWVVSSTTNVLFTDGMADYGNGLEDLAEWGSPATLDASLSADNTLASNGVFKVTNGTGAAGAIKSGDSYTFGINAAQGEMLYFATMFSDSNDLIYAPSGMGIALYDGSGNPISGDVTAQVHLWDAGTEVNQEPGVGADQPHQSGGGNVGAADSNNTVRMVNDGWDYPTDLIRVQIIPQ